MIYDFFRLIFVTGTGSIVTLFQLQQVAVPIQQSINFHVALMNGLLGLAIGALTIIFLVYQIRKIRRDLKIKKK